MRIIAAHLGLLRRSRSQQAGALLEATHTVVRPTVLLGDLNEWWLWGRPVRWLHAQFRRTPAPRTFPSRLPMFALDRLWVRPRSLLQRLAVHRSPLARIASDHLPLVATLGAREGDTPLADRAAASSGQEHQRARRDAGNQPPQRSACVEGGEVGEDGEGRR
jgi:endonuclease/exonuclease/phosphatase family metal-dependent hydrolase